jgi:hypothetical protein
MVLAVAVAVAVQMHLPVGRAVLEVHMEGEVLVVHMEVQQQVTVVVGRKALLS